MAQREPWMKQDGESDEAFMCFRRFLALPEPRALRACAEASGKSYQTIRRYPGNHSWRKRATAWDTHIATQQAELVLTEREKITREHLQAVRAARTLGTIAIHDLLRQAKQAGGSTNINARTALALLRDAVQLERLIIGEATERTETNDFDMSKLSGDEAELLLKLIGKMEAK